MSNLPKRGRRLLELLLPESKRYFLIGDFEEYFKEISETKGRKAAVRHFWYQLFISCPAFVYQIFQHNWLLLRQSLKWAFKNQYRHIRQSLLNLLGLALGISCFIILMLYVEEESSYDQWHSQADRIYRILDVRKANGVGEESTSAPTPLAYNLINDFPDEVAEVVRFFNFQAPTLALSYQSSNGSIQQFNEPHVYFVDASFFRVFDFQLLAGYESEALEGPNKIILSQAMARKYFGETDPMGKILRFEGSHDLMVSGVFQNRAPNTHFNFDFLVSFETLDNPEILNERLKKTWIWNPSWTYVLLEESTDPDLFEAQLPGFVHKHFPESRRDRVKLFLQPLTDIHLYSNLDYEMGPNGSIVYVYIFATVAFFILLISYINFMNLSTARASTRVKEIGIRKVLGGSKKQLVGQLLMESSLSNFLAVLLAIPMVYLLLEVIHWLVGRQLILNLIDIPFQPWQVLLAFFGMSLLGGLYPAIFVSSFQPLQVVKSGRIKESLGMLSVRKAMVIGQFTLSIVLIIGTFVALKQFQYLRDQSVGFDPEKVILLPSLRSPILAHYSAFKSQLLSRTEIKSMTTVEDIPGMKHQTGSYRIREGEDAVQIPRLVVHDDFLKTMGIGLVAGRDYEKGFQQDPKSSIIINETFAKQLGWTPQEAIGQSIAGESVVGVTEDFHFASLHNQMSAFILERVGNKLSNLSFSARYIAVRVEGGNLENTLADIEKVWYSFVKDAPFEYHLLDETLKEQYIAEANLGKLTGIFSVLSILIACLGLYGLSAFSAQRRIKEIGIRKVVGASMINLTLLLSTSFMKLVLVATVIAWPLAYYVLTIWLETFAYRIQLGAVPFLTAGALAFIIVTLTVCYQAIKTSGMNPVKSLRHE